jgi:hypothetical protein
VKTTGADVSSIPTHRTYVHAGAKYAPEGYGLPEGRPEIIEEIWRNIDAEMQRRGYELAEDGELIVRVSGGRRTYDKQPTGRAAAVGSTATEGTEGALVIDILERATGKELFHGYAHGVLPAERAEPAQVQKAVSKIMQSVPERSVAPR